jgi:hypothetical protein
LIGNRVQENKFAYRLDVGCRDVGVMGAKNWPKTLEKLQQSFICLKVGEYSWKHNNGFWLGDAWGPR